MRRSLAVLTAVLAAAVATSASAAPVTPPQPAGCFAYWVSTYAQELNLPGDPVWASIVSSVARDKTVAPGAGWYVAPEASGKICPNDPPPPWP